MAEQAQTAFTHLVVVGSSAGGIEALSTFVAGLQPRFPAPIVLAQHLEPTRQSHLGDILARRTQLPVRTVAEQEPLEPGVIYVVPSNYHVQITDDHVQLETGNTIGPKPSIDLLLTSAAQVFGDRLIAVILSGTGSDGAAGARVVKKAGGTVIIQDPDTAAYPGMPLSLAPTTVDIVATLDKMGNILSELLAGASVPTRPDERKQIDAFLAEVREHTGLDFNSYKTPTILRRLRRRTVATDSDDLAGYINYVHTHPEEYQQLINAFLIKVTEFFRDPDLFTYLRETILPDLVLQSRKRGNELRIWSAGCATGEEAYSLAIVISEVLGAALEHFNVRLFATDADADAVAFARRGIYPEPALAQLPDELISRYFTREDGNYQVRKRIRAMTVFGQHDLGGRAPFPRIDMVVCRNVLIYFTPELQQRTLRLFAYALRDSGYLVLGKAETPSQLSEFFVAQDKTEKVYRRHGDRILIPPARVVEPLPTGQHIALPQRPRVEMALTGAHQTQRRLRSSADALLLQLPVGVVIVDRRYDIQLINSAARRLLAIHGSAIGDDLIHEAQAVAHARLREAIDQAFRTDAPVTLEPVSVEEMPGGSALYLQFTCQPRHAEGEEGVMTDTVIVSIQDVTRHVQARQMAERQLETTSAALRSLRDTSEHAAGERDSVIARLVDTNRQIIEANQELTTANEELRSANEEFLLSAEEAQAAIEEAETLNEELQATIEELNTTNEDLNARTIELQELAVMTEQERAQLAAILRSIGDAVLVVNGAGDPLLTNPAYAAMFGGPSATFVAGDAQGEPLPPAQTPQARAAQGESFRMEFSISQQGSGRRWFDAQGEPIQGEGIAQGGVLLIREIPAPSQTQGQTPAPAQATPPHQQQNPGRGRK
ncbi:MAG TPA: CheR family methyltransferase [Ktedonobacterales bacterium]